MASTVLFYLFAGLAIASAIYSVYQNPLWRDLTSVKAFSLSCIYVSLAAPFIAAVQILIYARDHHGTGCFVIMLLNLDEDKPLNHCFGICTSWAADWA